LTYHFQLAAISKRFELGASRWAHFLYIFKPFPDLVNFLKINSAELAQRNKTKQFVFLFG
jgi:hypothetical protein